MKSKYSFNQVLFIGAFILFYITNPTGSDHRNGIVEKFKEQNEVLGAIAIGRIPAALVAYEDFHFFSVTKQGDEIVSLGFLNKVIVVSDMDLDI